MQSKRPGQLSTEITKILIASLLEWSFFYQIVYTYNKDKKN